MRFEDMKENSVYRHIPNNHYYIVVEIDDFETTIKSLRDPEIVLSLFNNAPYFRDSEEVNI